ncbi:MAG TPA: hypothetical protein DGO89_03035 [Microcoleaceae bacterium UBA9251]|nr:hypothetical protein [Microcoleaceae cyanobacterium UBA9251]
MSRLLQKPGFLDFGAWGSETGFLPKSRWGFQDYRRNPVSWITRGGLETGFLPKSWWGCRDCRRNPVSWTSCRQS